MGVVLQNRTIKVTIVTPKRVVKLDKVGMRGPSGRDAFQVWQSQPGNEGKTVENYLNWLANAQITTVTPYMNRAELAADSAEDSALAAGNSQQIAVGAAQTAATHRQVSEQKANDAVLSANAAGLARGQAEQSATVANASKLAAQASENASVEAKNLAQGHAGTAAVKAQESSVARDQAVTAQQTAFSNALLAVDAKNMAVSSAESALLSQNAAEVSANKAANSADAALGSQNSAKDSENAAALSETNASDSADIATTKAGEAQQSALDAIDAKNHAAQSKSDAADSALSASNARDQAVLAQSAAEQSENNASSYRNESEDFRNQSEIYRNQALQYRNEASAIVGGDYLSKAVADTLYRGIGTNLNISEINGLQDALDGQLTVAQVLAETDTRYYQPIAGETVATQSWANGKFRHASTAITKSEVGLGNVDNTSDANKPVSTAQQQALDTKQDLLGFTPANVADTYTKNQVDTALSGKQDNLGFTPADASETYTKGQVDDALSAQAGAIAAKQDALGFTPADASTVYTKTQVDAALDNKQNKLGFIPASAADTYTKGEVDSALASKQDALGFTPANAADTYTQSQVDAALLAQSQIIAGKQDALGYIPANATDAYTKGEVDASLANKASLNSDVSFSRVHVSGAASTSRQVRLRTGESTRWTINADASAESGANSGTNLTIDRYSDAGAYLGNVLNASRSTGVVNFAERPTVAGKPVWDTGNFNPTNKADLVGGKVPTAQLPAHPTVPTFATEGEVRAGKVDGKIISPKVMADALWPISITRTAAAAGMDFDSFINCNISLDANGTLGPPSGGYPGKSGVINVTNATGSATMAFASAYRMPKGGITIEAGVNASTRIPYTVSDAGTVILFPASKWSA